MQKKGTVNRALLSIYFATSLAAAGGSAAVFAFVASAVGRHEHAAFRAGGRAIEDGAHTRVLSRQIIEHRWKKRVRGNWRRQDCCG